MNKTTLAFISMFKSLFEFLNKHKTKLETFKEYVDLMQVGQPLYDNIVRVVPLLSKSTKEVTAHIDEIKDKLADACAEVVSCLNTYTHLNADSPFREISKKSKSHYYGISSEALIAEVQFIYQSIKDNEEIAISAGLSAEDIEELKSLYDLYNIKASETRSIREELHIMREELKNNLSDSKAWKNYHLTPFMRRRFRIKEPVFFDEFKVSIKMDTPSRHTRSVTGSVIDANTKELIEKVYISVDGGKAMRKGGKKEGFHFDYLPEGKHTLRFEMPGYLSKELTVVVVAGKCCTVKVELTPENFN